MKKLTMGLCRNLLHLFLVQGVKRHRLLVKIQLDL
jgi:hypothetical protein